LNLIKKGIDMRTDASDTSSPTESGTSNTSSPSNIIKKIPFSPRHLRAFFISGLLASIGLILFGECGFDSVQSTDVDLVEIGVGMLFLLFGWLFCMADLMGLDKRVWRQNAFNQYHEYFNSESTNPMLISPDPYEDYNLDNSLMDAVKSLQSNFADLPNVLEFAKVCSKKDASILNKTDEEGKTAYELLDAFESENSQNLSEKFEDLLNLLRPSSIAVPAAEAPEAGSGESVSNDQGMAAAAPTPAAASGGASQGDEKGGRSSSSSSSSDDDDDTPPNFLGSKEDRPDGRSSFSSSL
jgi:hypothetical protein